LGGVFEVFDVYLRHLFTSSSPTIILETIMKKNKSIKPKDDDAIVDLRQNIGEQMDLIESKIAENYELLVMPLVHRFTDGLYSREIELPKGALVTSRTHLVQHQFFLLSGRVSVWNNEGEEIVIEAPYVGITEPQTRRVVYAWEDSRWITCHPNPNNEVLEEFEDIIFEFHDNTLLSDEMKDKIKEAQRKSDELSITIDGVKRLGSSSSNKNKLTNKKD
jgi:hypothetical protein